MEDNLDSFLQHQLEFRIQKAIAEQMDDVIGKIQELSKKFSIGTKDKKSPFRNVLSVAISSTSSLEEIKVFIRTQIGRSGASPIWSTKIGNELFATALVNEIDSLKADTSNIVRNLRSSIPKNNPLNNYVDNPDNQKELTQKIHLKLTQLYLGYLAREHTALVGEAKFNSNSQN
ncbi:MULTISPECIES: hypothetical protein [Calothrix]|uniref:Uncharacterized protein n=2 Tax=Calothrix TaxID=1186 RepID=A0ABR8A4F1_9CYAN|nr:MULTISPECIES: hypothetical protein [Calothrix]MBD2194837.1 hypothetical protein [Calothrix parietina FACHB-288]MBD2223435.1 hypothetical protein [Calothrix anomala FACHB-343]